MESVSAVKITLRNMTSVEAVHRQGDTVYDGVRLGDDTWPNIHSVCITKESEE